MKPNLFIVGAVKSGTTSMHAYLAQHPDIYMSDRKEIHFFDCDIHESSDSFHGKKVSFPVRNEDKYLKQFQRADDSNIVGESSPMYLISKVAAKGIRDFNPSAKIIILLREPVSLLFSWHQQLLINGEENIADFEEALKQESARHDGQNVPKTALAPDYLFYSEIIDFAPQIKRYLDQFPTKQIKVLLLDQIRENPQETYQDVLHFLGVSEFEADISSKNIRRKVQHPWLHNLFLQAKKSSLKRYVPTILRKLWYRSFNNIVLQRASPQHLDAHVESRLKNSIRTKVKATNQLLHKHHLIDVDLLELWDY
jgi:hypothetical protein